MEKKYDIFISYRRSTGEYTAKILHDRLTEMGYKVFFDVESLRAGAFNTKLYSVIDECRDFIIVLSPNSLDRCVNEEDWVRREVEYALTKKKNVIPVMLKGFTFPEVLPEPIEELRYQNGMEANTQYFDAFLQQLLLFLSARLPWWKRLGKVWVALAALVAAVCVFFGVRSLVGQFTDTYPHTNAEKNLTQEAVYYVSDHLTYYSMLCQCQEEGILAAQRYLSTGSADITVMEGNLNASRSLIAEMDVGMAAPSDIFLQQLADSPFPVADFLAMHDELVRFQEECMDTMNAIDFLVSRDCMLSDTQKLETLDYYLDYLEANMQANAYATNQMLLPITEKEALTVFWEDILPEVRYIPLNAANWGDDYDVLQSSMDECLNKMEAAVLGQYKILGNLTMETAQEQAILTGLYVKLGYTRERAERIVEDIIFDYETKQQNLTEQYVSAGFTQEEAQKYAQQEIKLLQLEADVRLQYSALEFDDAVTLWEKMMVLLSCGLYDEARECATLYGTAVEGTDPYAAEYIPAVQLFISNMENGGTPYGAMVVGFVEEKSHEVFRIGDVVIAFNGEPCASVDAYIEKKTQLTENRYTVTVLRANEKGTMEEMTLDLTKDMPAVSFNTLVD